MEKLVSTNKLIIHQKKEWGQILTGLEMKNRYVVKNDTGSELYMVAEENGPLLGRIFLKAMRPFEMHIMTLDGNRILRLMRPFRFFFHKIYIFDSNSVLLGTVQRRFSLLRRIYSVLDSYGREIFILFGPILHPWTFIIKQQTADVGKITKRWSGLLKETFTVADNFGIEFPAGADINQRAILLGAVFLVDFVHFENRGRR